MNGNSYAVETSVDICTCCFFCKQKKTLFLRRRKHSVKLGSDLSTGKNVTVGTEKIKAFLCLPSHRYHTVYFMLYLTSNQIPHDVHCNV